MTGPQSGERMSITLLIILTQQT